MSVAPIQFPLTLRPVVRSHAGGEPTGRRLPYHAAVIIVDRAGRQVLHIAPNIDDLLAGRTHHDPHQLVSRASRAVTWLYNLQSRLASWTAVLDSSPALLVRPVIVMREVGTDPATTPTLVDAGVQFCTAPDEEFDRLTRPVYILADDTELNRSLDPLHERVLREYEAALKILTELQEAVHSWRIAEELASAGHGSLVIEDGSVEH